MALECSRTGLPSAILDRCRAIAYLQRQFLQEGELPFTDVLSEEKIKHALKAVDVARLNRLSFNASQ